MKASIQRRGNVRFPNGVIAPIPKRPRAYQLHELLSRITKKNLHAGLMAGAPLGKEIW